MNEPTKQTVYLPVKVEDELPEIGEATFTFLRAYFSPFKRPKINWYVGKVAVGVPYFYPRKWIKGTPKLIHEAVLKHIQSEENYNKLNQNHARKIKSYEELYEEKKNCFYAVPKKIGFDFVSLGYKTKWSETDYRFEWPPIFSFVFFDYQIAATIVAPESHHYWEAWLYYENHTDRSKSVKDRLKDCMSNFPLTYTSYPSNEKKDYYDYILKDKWKIQKQQ